MSFLRLRLLLPALICLYLFSACSKDTQIVFKVQNLSTAPLTIIYADNFNQSDTDTVVVNVQKIVTIASHNHGFGSVTSYKEKSAQLKYLQYISISKADTVPATGDYYETNRWSYLQENDQYATYTLYIRDTDF